MIKHIGILALAILLSTSAYENESLAQGFGGFHGRVRTRGVGYGGIVGYPRYRTGRVGYGYGYGNVGNPYGAVGGVTTVGGMRVGGRNYVAPTAANLALADMALSNRYDRPAPTGPAPGPGPIGIDEMAKPKDKDAPGTNSRTSALDALNQSLKHSTLPGDAGLPAAKGAKNASKNK